MLGLWEVIRELMRGAGGFTRRAVMLRAVMLKMLSRVQTWMRMRVASESTFVVLGCCWTLI